MEIDPDLWLAIGLMIVVLCVPSILSAWAQYKPPRASAVTAVIGLSMILVAFWAEPGGYGIGDIPIAVTEAIGRYLL